MSVLNQSGDEVVECPLCMEPLEVDDLNFFPCTCGYQICRFCWHRIRTDENGLCPACRKAYSENPADFKPLSKEELAKLKAEKRLKDQQRKQRVTENRKHLANVRVVQKNLVFVVGLPMRLADADVLKKHEYFGKFGKIHKVVINQSTSYAGSQGPSASAYVTYQRQEDALRAIEAVNNITVDGRTVKTSLGTTKYCSHFMRNQSCPKPDCMYLHDLGDQEASFTKEEMHQGKHQEYERKLVQSLHINSTQRKPTPSPPVPGGITIGPNTQAKEAWPSLQPGQTKEANSKESSPTQQANSHPIENGVVVVPTNPAVAAAVLQKQQQNNNNNNKGESAINARRGKSNSESKAQAARNKHKNSQNKEKHSSTSGTRRSESNSNINQNGQKDSIDITTTTSTTTTEQAQKTRLKSELCLQNNNKTTNKLVQQVQELKINGILQNGDQDNEEMPQQQREGGTPASTISSSEDSSSIISTANQQVDRLLDPNCEESIGNSTLVLGTSPANSSSSQSQSHQHQQLPAAPPGLHSTSNSSNSTSQPAHRSIFQSDNNSFFSSNSFQKLPANSAAPSTSQSGNIVVQDWTSGVIAPIPDSLPTVYSSEDWQAAFGFQTSSTTTSVTDRTSINGSPKAVSPAPPSATTRISFSNEDFTLDPDPPSVSNGGGLVNGITSSILANTQAATQHFMAEFHQSSLQQRITMQSNIETSNSSNLNEYAKQNGHATSTEIHKQQSGESLKADDDLGFDPFHETQKALAELMENEIKLQQQRLFQQQQQIREREEQTRLQQQHTVAGLAPHPFSQQVNHLTHMQQAQQLQNFQVLQQSQQQQQQHSLISRLPTPLLQQQQQQQNGGTQSPVTVASLGQRSRLPPPGFPSSTPNHMNSFGLGIPRPAPNSNTLTGSKILPFVSHSSGVLFNGGQQTPQTSYLQNQNPLLGSQGIGKCANDTIYAMKDWCDNSQSQQQFHHQPLYQKSSWNNYSAISDVNTIDPAIVSSRLLPFQTANSTWQFPQAHTSHNIPHNAQQEQSAPATQHWAMQPPPGFATPSPNVPLGVQPTGTAVQAHTKFISAGSEIENV